MAAAPRDFNAEIIEEFRSNHGNVSAFPSGALLLLHHHGAKTGEARVNPLVYLRDGERYAVFATKGGAPEHPAWYHNLRADPRVEIELADRTFPALAAEALGDERDRLFDAQARRMPQFGEYQRRADRKIPVMVLTAAG